MRVSGLGRTQRITVLLAICAMTSACASRHPESLPLLEKEVRASIREGMKTDEAIARLAVRGFSCLQQGTSLNPERQDVRECTRTRGSICPPYACVQRVWLDFDAATQIISGLQIPQPACASL